MVELWMEHGSYLGIMLLLILTGCGLPLPEEVPIIAAGVAASVGKLDPRLAFASCLSGALIGDSLLYAIGYHFGHNLMRLHPKLGKLLHADREAKMERYINRYGMSVLFVARFLVVVRAPVYLSVGILRHSFRKFLLIDAVCATAVVGLFFGLSYAFGDHVAEWVRRSEKVFTVLVIAGVVVAGLVFYWLRRKAVRKATGFSAEATTPKQRETETLV